MPYISQDERDLFDSHIEDLVDEILYHERNDGDRVNRAGYLNYIITKLLKELYGDMRYKDHNELIGMLECCKMEWYRVMSAPYEDEKMDENGEV